MFLHRSVILFIRRGSPGPHPGREVEGSGWGGYPGPHPEGVSQRALRHPPQETATAAGQGIILECILVQENFILELNSYVFEYNNYTHFEIRINF